MLFYRYVTVNIIIIRVICCIIRAVACILYFHYKLMMFCIAANMQLNPGILPNCFRVKFYLHCRVVISHLTRVFL